MAAVLLSNTMAQNQNSNVNNDVKPTIFHDFLGGDCPPLPNHAATGGPPSASASRAVGPISTTSDLSSDRQVGSRLEGMPFYGQKSNFPGSDIANRYAGNKRSNSDSVPDFPDNSHLMKMVRPMRPIVQAATDSNPSKWERAIPVNVGPVLQYPSSRTPYPYQQISNKFKDPMSRGTSVISQSAADEGSRTGIKGSGVLKSVNVNVGEPSSSNPIREGGSMSGGRQMTIFYGGQAHVFDDVHPNKADAIMGMAGSSGGSWSTNYSQNSSIKPSPSIKMSENNILPVKDMRDRFNSTHGTHGGHSGVLMTDARRPSEAGQEKP